MSHDPTPQFPSHIPLVLIVSGPAGAGKTSLVNALLASSDRFLRAITCTTRKPRGKEIDGVDYHFLSPDEFQRRAKRGDFLETATVYGFDYGMPAQNVTGALEQERDLVINIDVQGASTIRRRADDLSLESLSRKTGRGTSLSAILVTVFIMPASITQLEDRLKKRGTDDPATIQRRLAVVRQEMQRWTEYDYVIVSGALSEDLRQLQGIITAERLKTARLKCLV